MRRFKYYAIGHSYLAHGPFEGWQTEGLWGMAAGEPEKDYFHTLQRLLQEQVDCEIQSVAENHADLERLCKEDTKREDYEISGPIAHIKAQLQAFRPNIITIFLDANCIAKSKGAMELFYDVLYGTVAREKPEGAVVLCPVSAAWNEVKAKAAERSAAEYGFFAVDIQKIHACGREENPYFAFAQYPDYQGEIEFRTHPGDLGHRYIAERIFEVLKAHLPEETEEGAPLGEAAKRVEKSNHVAGKWFFDHLDETKDLVIGGFNLRLEDSCLKLSAAVDTGVSVGAENLSLCARSMKVRAAVEGDAKNLRFVIEGDISEEYVCPVENGKMQSFEFPWEGKVHGFRITPDGLDCCLVVDEILFE